MMPLAAGAAARTNIVAGVPGKPPIEEDQDDDVPELWMAAAEGDTAKVQQLVEAGAEIAWEDEFGSTALHCACTNGHVLCARLLLTGRASVDQTNKNGATALHVACCDGHDNCAELLLAANAAWRARA